jgi:branched-chain amino acid aminotransferase
VLGGITRGTVIELARDKGIPVEERAITRDELYTADEVFLTGTAAEVTPIREIDRRAIGAGSRGPIAATLQKAFFDVVSGREAKYERWLTTLGGDLERQRQPRLVRVEQRACAPPPRR